jgi:L-alanine-DL-glutamate epimerase-like enolase superfamily enzyme
MVDANMKWNADESIRRARAFQPYDLTWLEEPTIPDDVAGHARIAREGGVPIATGKNLRTLWEFKQMIAAGGVSYPEPDVTNCGGVDRIHESRTSRRGPQSAGDVPRRT